MTTDDPHRILLYRCPQCWAVGACFDTDPAPAQAPCTCGATRTLWATIHEFGWFTPKDTP